jgi:demethylspheroidene O-methyltransferase
MSRLEQVLRARRDALLTDPAALRRLESIPLFRPVVQRSARRLFDLMAGFTYTQTLLALIRLGILDRLGNGPARASELAEDLRLSQHAVERLLRAAAPLGLVESRGKGRYGLGLLAGPAITRPEIRTLIEHHALLYDDLRDPVALLRNHATGDLSRYWGYVQDRDRARALDDTDVAPYSAVMRASLPPLVDLVLESYDLSRHRQLLDVGGGEGVFVEAIARRAPALELVLFDLPAVASRAERRLSQSGLTRIRCVGGSFFDDPLPRGADIVTLIRVCFDHPDERVLTLLRRIHDALEPGGTVLLAEPMAAISSSDRVGDTYFGWYLWAMGAGEYRTPSELAALLQSAGFRDIRQPRTRQPLQVGVVTARRA